MFSSVLVWVADQQGEKVTKGKKERSGHLDDKIRLDSVRLLGITGPSLRWLPQLHS